MDPNVVGSDYINANFVGVSKHTTTMFKKNPVDMCAKSYKIQVRASDFLHTIYSFSIAIIIDL